MVFCLFVFSLKDLKIIFLFYFYLIPITSLLVFPCSGNNTRVRTNAEGLKILVGLRYMMSNFQRINEKLLKNILIFHLIQSPIFFDMVLFIFRQIFYFPFILFCYFNFLL